MVAVLGAVMQNLAFQISLLQNPAHNLNVALAGAIIEVVSLVSPHTPN